MQAFLILATSIIPLYIASSNELDYYAMDDLIPDEDEDTTVFWMSKDLRSIVRSHLAYTGRQLCPRVNKEDRVYAEWARKMNNTKIEPCTKELQRSKEKWGPEGHLHHDAPQCTELGLYAPVQCRGWVCYCAVSDGTRIPGIKVPRTDSDKMNCDCARVRCRIQDSVECDAYGNYNNHTLAYYDTVPHLIVNK